VSVPKTARERWLDAGMRLLTREGNQGLTIEALCQQLGLTKGSFYHHFPNQQAYAAALLEHWQQERTLQLISLSEVEDTPAARLQRLMELATESAPSPLELAIRTWAAQDPLARGYQERVDAQRIGYLVKLVEPLVASPDEALIVARLLYTVLIGSQYLSPPLDRDELRQIYRFLNRRALGLDAS
jgi:AcrR family transcriptional regulator